jgi:hypothetical protein
MVRSYWWGVENGKRKTHWTAWDKMICPKSHGGLGFRDMRLFNQALLARQAWRLIDRPGSLCARLMKAKYYRRGNLADTVFAGNASAVWRGIEYGLELLKKGIIWRIGDGRTVRCWRDPWIPRVGSRRPLSDQGTCRFTRVASFLLADGTWNEELLRRYMIQEDVELILKIKTARREEGDFIAWQPEHNGMFTVKSAYHLAVSENLREAGGVASSNRPDGARPIWKVVWQAKIPQKVKICAWRLAVDGLPTMKLKQRRNLATLDTCIRCGMEAEDAFHVVISCPSSAMVWEAMREVWELPEKEELLHTGHEWLLDLLARSNEHTRARIMMLVWRNWQLRNDAVHDKPNPPVEMTRRYLCSYMDSLMCLNQPDGRDLEKGKSVVGLQELQAKNVVVKNTTWPKPATGWVAITVDGSFLQFNGSAGIGCIVRDHTGAVLMTACKAYENLTDAYEAELLAVKEGLVLALQYPDAPLLLQSDSSAVLKTLKEEGDGAETSDQWFKGACSHESRSSTE